MIELSGKDLVSMALGVNLDNANTHNWGDRAGAASPEPVEASIMYMLPQDVLTRLNWPARPLAVTRNEGPPNLSKPFKF